MMQAICNDSTAISLPTNLSARTAGNFGKKPLRLSSFITLLCFPGLLSAQILATAGPGGGSQLNFTGMCDASAAVAIDDQHILVAEDEVDILYLYRFDNPANHPVGPGFDFSAQLRENPRRETDIEDAVRVGNRVYWIASHGRNKDGKKRPNRHRFFATDVAGSADQFQVTWVGKHETLLADILKPETWVGRDLKTAEKVREVIREAAEPSAKKAKRLAPKNEGLNIEALAASRDGRSLFIGFRNPLLDGQAIVLELANPDELVEKEGATASIRRAILLDLGGLGLREMIYSEVLASYVLIAGAAESGGIFKLFQWDGGSKVTLMRHLEARKNSSPEALVEFSDQRRLLILNDEGTRPVGDLECKAVPPEERSFTGAWYELPQ